MRIAVCDDEKVMAEALRVKLERFPFVEKIRSFQSMEPFWQLLEEGAFPDVVFMDIEWNQKECGIDFAEQIYKINPDIQIIFVTGYNARYSQTIFLNKCNLCGYMAKPIDPVILEGLLEKVQENIASGGEQKLVIQQKGTVYAIPLRKILYLESAAHQLIVHTKDETITYYDRLDHVKEMLPGCFLQCHKSYLVNMNFIRRVDKNEILLQTGETIPISKAHYTETRNAYFRYVAEIL